MEKSLRADNGKSGRFPAVHLRDLGQYESYGRQQLNFTASQPHQNFALSLVRFQYGRFVRRWARARSLMHAHDSPADGDFVQIWYNCGDAVPFLVLEIGTDPLETLRLTSSKKAAPKKVVPTKGIYD